MKNFKDFLNESSEKEWVKQTGSDYVSYGLLISKNVSGGHKAVVFTSFNGSESGKAKITSTKGWHPAPVSISEKDVPEKIKSKIFAKANA